MSLYSLETTTDNRAAWTRALTLDIDTLFSLYRSLGDVTITSPTQVATLQDGPIQVTRAGALTVNAAYTRDARCRGWLILCDSLTMGAAGSISMTARGAAGNARWVSQNILIPSAPISFAGAGTTYEAFLAWIRETGYCIFDPNLYVDRLPGLGDVTANYASWPDVGAVIISNAGCGAGGEYAGGVTGVNGAAGVNAPGGGGQGGNIPYISPWGGRARVWGGGPGGAGGNTTSRMQAADQFGGPGGGIAGSGGHCGGGGAGNPGGPGGGTGTLTDPGGNGTGGPLFIICRGAVNLTAGHLFSVNGVAGGNAAAAGSYAGGGGGSGAGYFGLFRGGALTGTLNATATGGPGGTAVGSPAGPGGAGGAGAVVSKTFTEMGWT